MSNYSDSAYDDNNPNNSWYKALRLVPESSTVLDIGCSSGHFGSVLIEMRKCVVDGIELFAADAKEAKKHLRNVYNLNIETDSLDEIKAKYDVIYFGDVIEHLVLPSAALLKVKSLLKKGGKIVFSVPNMGHATIRLQLLRGNFEYTETGLLDKTHLHFYTLDELEKVFMEAGYNFGKVEFVEKDYPNDLIEDYLQTLGLSGSKKFYDLMHEPAAAAFQFVGEAIPSARPVKIRREQFGPIDMFEDYHKNIVKQEKRIQKNLRRDLESKNKTLEGIYSSKTWKIAQMLQKSYNKVSNSVKPKH